MNYTITDENKADAWRYIERKLSNEPLYLDHLWEAGSDKEKLAKKSFQTLWPSSGSAKDMLANEVDTWCKANLTDKQFNAMRLALRKKASRRNKRYESIELEQKAYGKLNDLAADADMSMKEYMVMLIDERHEKENPPFANKASKRRLK